MIFRIVENISENLPHWHCAVGPTIPKYGDYSKLFSGLRSLLVHRSDNYRAKAYFRSLCKNVNISITMKV